MDSDEVMNFLSVLKCQDHHEALGTPFTPADAKSCQRGSDLPRIHAHTFVEESQAPINQIRQTLDRVELPARIHRSVDPVVKVGQYRRMYWEKWFACERLLIGEHSC